MKIDRPIPFHSMLPASSSAIVAMMWRMIWIGALAGCAWAQLPEVVSRTLPNGLRAMAVTSTNEAADVYLAVGAGSGDDTHATAGLAHLVEHAMFAGTPEIGPGEFERRVRSWGGRANAYTREDHTLFYNVGVPTNRLAELLRMEADRLVNLDFGEEAFAFERGRLREEEADTTTLRMRIDAWVEAVAYPDHGYGAGVFSNLHTQAPWLGTAVARRFYEAHYQPGNCALVIVSALPGETALALCGKAFAGVEGGRPAARRPLPRLPRLESRTVLAAPLGQPRHEVVYRLPPAEPESLAVLDLLVSVLERRAADMAQSPRVLADERRDGGLLRIVSHGTRRGGRSLCGGPAAGGGDGGGDGSGAGAGGRAFHGSAAAHAAVFFARGGAGPAGGAVAGAGGGGGAGIRGRGVQRAGGGGGGAAGGTADSAADRVSARSGARGGPAAGEDGRAGGLRGPGPGRGPPRRRSAGLH